MSREDGRNRRSFLKRASGATAGAALYGAIAARGHAAESNEIKVALVGCGGRGAGAADNALTTEGPVKLWAVADVFENRIKGGLDRLTPKHAGKIDVGDRRYVGMDAYARAIDAIGPGGVVLLATPPAFRPQHFEYAVAKGCHVFMEKSFAVDGPGVRRVLKAGELAAKKNLKVAGGLMSRHSPALEAAIEQIRGGAIGDVLTCWAYRCHGPVDLSPRPQGATEMAHQIRNYSCFTWLNGSFLLDWLIHNIDVCCWVKDAWPVSVQGQGGRQVRTQPDQLFDHYTAEYSFADGTRLLAQGRHMGNCWGFFGSVIFGSKGSAVLGEGVAKPKLYKGHARAAANEIWEYQGANANAYEREHALLFDAIRNDKPYNETERCAHAALAGIMGRMACESGKQITWDDALASSLELAPGLDALTMDSDPPVLPGADGKYPVAMPGITKVL